MKRFASIILITLAGCSSTSTISKRAEMPSQSSRFGEVVGAMDVVDGLEDRRRNGEPLTPIFLEMEYTWSRRLCEAERNNTSVEDARLKALQAHLQRMTDIQHVLTTTTQDPSIPAKIVIGQMNYYVAEAELWVAEAGKK